MKIWFDPAHPSPKPVLGINRLGNAGEDFVDAFPSALVHGKDNEFYEVSGGALVAKDQAVVDAIKSQREADETARIAARQDAAQEIVDKIGQFTKAQLTSAVENAFPDPAQKALVLKLAFGVRALVELNK